MDELMALVTVTGTSMLPTLHPSDRTDAVMEHIAGGNGNVRGFKGLFHNVGSEAVVDIFYHAVDHVGKFAFPVKLGKLSEMSAVLIVFQRMLNVSRNGCIDIFACFLGIGKGRIFVVVDAAHAHRSAVTDIRIDSGDTKNRFKFAVRDKGGMQIDTPVVELIASCKYKSEGVRAGQYDLHPTACIDIRKERGAFDEIRKQSDFVENDIPKAVFLQ